ncbi:MAG: hypothetical protein FJ125_02195, partial [Deltaproteobacteria bacterium]|nr:hypothetical protein [Deltaproteobacteria bacterium]
MADPPARAGPAGVATGSGTGPVGGRGRRRAAAARARASLQPVLLALLLLANPGAARGEMGFALQSAVPMTIGLEFGAGMHLAWELA